MITIGASAEPEPFTDFSVNNEKSYYASNSGIINYVIENTGLIDSEGYGQNNKYLLSDAAIIIDNKKSKNILKSGAEIK